MLNNFVSLIAAEVVDIARPIFLGLILVAAFIIAVGLGAALWRTYVGRED